MPRKPNGQPRGRKPGGKNKATLEREALALREHAAREAELTNVAANITQARRLGRKLAREVLDDLMQLGMGMVATFQPHPPAPGQAADAPNANPFYSEDKFWTAANFTMECAKALASYQSPKLKAEVQVPLPKAPGEQEIMPPLYAQQIPSGASKAMIAVFREQQYFRTMKRVEG